MNTPQQESLQVPELTPEQNARFNEKFYIDHVGIIGRGNDRDVAEIFPYDEEGRQIVPDVVDIKAHLATELALQRRELEQKHYDRLLIIQSIVVQSVVLAIDNFSAGRPKEAFNKLEQLRKYGKERLIKRGVA